MIRVCMSLFICLGLLVACSDDTDKPEVDSAVVVDFGSKDDVTSLDGPVADGPVTTLDGPAFLDAPLTPDGQTDSQTADTVQPDTVKMCGNIGCNCMLNGIQLWGKVKEVQSFPDFKVKVVPAFEDLKVKKVNSFANSCGEWEFLDPTAGFPDFTIEFVQSFPDFTIRYDSFPGLP